MSCHLKVNMIKFSASPFYYCSDMFCVKEHIKNVRRKKDDGSCLHIFCLTYLPKKPSYSGFLMTFSLKHKSKKWGGSFFDIP